MLLEELPQLGGRRKLDLIGDTADIDRNDLHGCRLLEATEVIPAESGGVSGKALLEHFEHILADQRPTQGLEEVALRDGGITDPQPGNDLAELLRTHQTVGPQVEEVVDRGVADRQPGLLCLLRQQHRLHDRLLAVREQLQAGDVPACLHGSLGHEPIDHFPHRDGPFDPTFPDLSPSPTGHDAIGAAGGTAPHLHKWREDNEGKHRQDGGAHKQPSLVQLKSLEGTGHGTA